jgi:hypothetical protein
MSARLRWQQELAADELAVSALADRGHYLKALASLALRTPARTSARPLPWSAMTGGTFLRRIEMLHDKRLRRPLGWTIRCVILSLLAGAGLLLTQIGDSVSRADPAPEAMVWMRRRAIQTVPVTPLQPAEQQKKEEIVLEFKLISVSKQVLAAFQKAGATDGIIFLGEMQAFMFLESAQGDNGFTMLETAKLSLANSQTGNIDMKVFQFFVTGIKSVWEKEQGHLTPINEPIALGVKLTASPAASADRRFIRLKIDGQWKAVDGPVRLIPAKIEFPLNTNPLPEPPPRVETGNSDKRASVKPSPSIPIHQMAQGGAQAKSVELQMFFQQPNFRTIKLNDVLNIADGGTAVIDKGLTQEDQRLLMMVTARIGTTMKN